MTHLTLALAAILGFALAGAPITVQAKTAAKPAAAAPSALTFNGPIMAVDTTANTITVQSTPTPSAAAAATADASKKKKKSKGPAGTTLLLTVNSSTKISGAGSTLADFKVGDKVSGTYVSETSGSLTATTLTSAPATAAAPAAKKASSKTPKKSSSSSDSSSGSGGMPSGN